MHDEHRPRGNGSHIWITIIVSGFVSACVAAVVAGVAILILRLEDRATSAPVEEAWTDDSAIAFEVGAVDETLQRTFSAEDDMAHYHVFDLPADAIRARVDLDGGDVDLDMDVAIGEDAAEDAEWVASSTGAEGRETISVGRIDDPAFGRKPLVARVIRYGGVGLGGTGEDVPYTLRVSIVRHTVEERLAPGDVVTSTVDPASAHRRAYELVLPDGVDDMRLDLVGVRQNLDLAVHPGPLHDVETAAAVARTSFGRETLRVSRSELRLARGEQVLELVVVDAAAMDRAVPFTLLVTEGTEAPDAVRELPPPPTGATVAERLAAAIVSVITIDNEGSGVSVGTSGRTLLTAAHVVDTCETAADTVVIAINDDATREPIEAVRGRVTHRDEHLDLAIIELTQTYAGEPLPDEWRLPTVRVRWNARATLGERVHAVGFPMLHPGGDRAEVTWTTGTVSGYERHEGHLNVRTDAEIAGGSSGGALVDDALRLVGVVTSAHGDSTEFTSTGVAVPPESFPAEWRDLLR